MSKRKQAEIVKEFFSLDPDEVTSVTELNKIYREKEAFPKRKVLPIKCYGEEDYKDFSYVRWINKNNLSYVDIREKEFNKNRVKLDRKDHYYTKFNVNEDGSYYAHSIFRMPSPQNGYFDWCLFGEIPIKPSNKILVDFFTNKIIAVAPIKDNFINRIILKIKLYLLGYKVGNQNGKSPSSS